MMAKTEPGEAAGNDLSQYQVSGHAGDIIFREGDASADVYIIQEGRVELVRHDAGKFEQTAVLESGDFFGELSVLDGAPREVTARALSAFTALRLNRATFIQLARENPEIPIRMLVRAARRLHARRDPEWSAAKAAAASSAQGRVDSPPAPPADAGPAAPAPPLVKPEVRDAAAFFLHETSGTELPIPEGRIATVGRPDRTTGYTPDVNLTGLDPNRTCGRRHAYVISRDGAYYLLDETGTGNGSFINDVRIAKGVETALADGDRVRFGLVDLVFKRQ